MCCRYWADESPEIRAIVEEMNRSALVGRWQKTTGITTYGEICPSNVVPVIAPDRNGRRAVFPMKWGYTGRSLLMNARVETAAVKPTFREDWKKHRCVVPAGFLTSFCWIRLFLLPPDEAPKLTRLIMQLHWSIKSAL